jgi:uncharacterized protein
MPPFRFSGTAVALSLLKAGAFVVAAVVLLIATGPLTGMAVATLGIARVEVWTFAAVFSALMLAATVAVLRLEGATLRVLGLAPSRQRICELVTGFAIGAALFVSLALVRASSVGAVWTFAGGDASMSALAGLAVALLLLLPEELIFRGYAFRRLIDALGAGPAIGISAVLFGLYHVAGSGMWGVGAMFQFAMPALGGLVFGWTAVRSGGLSLPIGLHLGGNWVQASVLSFAGSSGSGPRALWTAQLSDVQQQYLFAPDLAPHLPYIITMGVGMLILRATLHRREPIV